jgi:hypothetical protein
VLPPAQTDMGLPNRFSWPSVRIFSGEMEGRFEGAGAGFSDSVARHEAALHFVFARGEEFRVFRIQLAAERAFVRELTRIRL